MNYLKHPRGTSSRHDEAMEIGRPLTPRSERSASSLGLPDPLSVQTVRGLCEEARKCVRKDGHPGQHWPE